MCKCLFTRFLIVGICQQMHEINFCPSIKNHFLDLNVSLIKKQDHGVVQLMKQHKQKQCFLFQECYFYLLRLHRMSCRKTNNCFSSLPSKHFPLKCASKSSVGEQTFLIPRNRILASGCDFCRFHTVKRKDRIPYLCFSLIFHFWGALGSCKRTFSYQSTFILGSRTCPQEAFVADREKVRGACPGIDAPLGLLVVLLEFPCLQWTFREFLMLTCLYSMDSHMVDPTASALHNKAQ